MFDPNRIAFLDHESEVLKGNPLGDPHQRKVPVYLPPGYHDSPGKRYPVLFGLIGFTGAGYQYLYGRYLRPGFDKLLDGLITDGMPPVIFVMPDCLTALGGSQYVNSSATGRYEDYIVQELVPLIDQAFRTTGERGCVGGSSGGIGSFTLAAKHADVFQGFADHSGDSGFESCYLNDIPKFVQAIAKYGHSVENFVRQIPSILPKDDQFEVILNFVAMASCYSPNPDAPLGFEMPFDTYTGRLNPEVWEKWRAHDPVNMVAPLADNLRKLKFRYVDCGVRDQFHLFLGARQLHEELDKHGIEHVFDEYDSDHFLLRWEQKKKSIPMLVKAISES
jgi:enterochelin esterase family protein